MSKSLFPRFVSLVRSAALRAVVAGCAGAAMAPHPAAAVVIAPGQSMQVTFSFPSAPSLPANIVAALPPGDPLLVADVLEGFLRTAILSGFGAPLAEIQFFNGGTLLGTIDESASVLNAFAFDGPGSVFAFNSVAAADFSSIRNGSIQGVFRVTNISTAEAGFGQPAPTFDLTISDLLVGHANGAQQFLTFGPAPVIGTEALVGVAEPGAAGLFVLALGGMALIRRGARGGVVFRFVRWSGGRVLDRACVPPCSVWSTTGDV